MLAGLTVLWWIIDAVDQLIPAWMFVLGLVIVGTGLISHGGLITIISWIIYWLRIRE